MMTTSRILFVATTAVLTTIAFSAGGGGLEAATPVQEQQPAERLDACNVVWDSPSRNSTGSMPLGNGDIGLNAWVEENGDLLFFIPFGFDTPKLASALMERKMGHGEPLYPQAAQCFCADVSLGLCREVSEGGYE